MRAMSKKSSSMRAPIASFRTPLMRGRGKKKKKKKNQSSAKKKNKKSIRAARRIR